MRLNWGAAALAAVAMAAGCVTPRSTGFGQRAQLLGSGGASASASTGVMVEIVPSQSSLGSTSVGTSFPAIEGNVGLGLGEMVDLNVHLSSAGLQPGLKIGGHSGSFHFAVMPQASILLIQSAYAASSGTGGNSSSSLSWGILAGLKVLMAFDEGFYAGLGYDFQYGAFGTGSSSIGTYNLEAHNVTINVGWDFAIGRVHLRPELAVTITPAYSSPSSTGSGSGSSGQVYAVMPGISFALESPRAPAARATVPSPGE